MNEAWDGLWAAYEDHLRIRGYAARTIETKRWNIERFFAFLESAGIHRPGDVDRSVLERFREERFLYVNRYGKPDCPLTQAKYIETVRCFFRYLKKAGHLPKDPAEDFEYPKIPRRLQKPALTHEEMKKLLRQPDVSTLLGFRDRTILEFLYSTGVRLGELRRVLVEEVDLEGQTVFVREGKGKKDRVVPLGRIACVFLENYLNGVRPLLQCPWTGEEVFLSSRGNCLSESLVGSILKKYGEEAGIEKSVSPHTFRRSFATELFLGGAKAAHVKDMLGHENFESLAAYLNLTIQDLKAAHKKHHPRERDKER